MINKPYKVYGENHIDPKAMDQFYSAMEMEWVVQGAVMPDAHFGYSLPIGGVVATDGVIVPAWVGYDIGCGMCAYKTSFDVADIYENRTEIFNQIYRDVPVGFKHNKRPAFNDLLFENGCSEWFHAMYVDKGGAKQLGTLGGGNHFIEIGADTENHVWIIVHSGSRNVGHSTATHYMKVASGTNKAKEGHFGLQIDKQAGSDYYMDMVFCLKFARKNRDVILDRVIGAIYHVTGATTSWNPKEIINRTHNHALFDLDTGLLVHRKGATHAEKGMLGIIPGNMRDGSFIVRGKGCSMALNSSSHGAGRVMSRKQARSDIFLQEFHDQLYEVTAKVDATTIDESPDAYKPIQQVMDDQKDLVEIITHVTPIINIKG